MITRQTDLTISEGDSIKKTSNLTENVFPTMIVKNVYEAIKMNRKAKYSWLQDNLGVSESTIQRAIDDLKSLATLALSILKSKVSGNY